MASAAWKAPRNGFLTFGVPVAICVGLNQGSPMPSLAKLTRLKVHRAVPRERLFKELDESRERPLVWVVAPPGSGKTTLVSTYVDARKLPTAWYHIDAARACARTG